jgi:hypothetical protein
MFIPRRATSCSLAAQPPQLQQQVHCGGQTSQQQSAALEVWGAAGANQANIGNSKGSRIFMV